MTQRELLRSIEFHDLPVRRMCLDFDVGRSSFILDFATYDDDGGRYVEWSLQFVDLVEFASSGIGLASDSDLEIHSFELDSECPFKGTMLLLTGNSKPGLTVKFECRSLVLGERTTEAAPGAS